MDFVLNKRRKITKCCINNCKCLEVDPVLLSHAIVPKYSGIFFSIYKMNN